MQSISNADHENLQSRYDNLVKETATLEQAIDRRASQLDALQKVGLDIASGLALGETLQRIARHAVELLNASASCVSLTQVDGSLEVMSVYNMPEAYLGVVFQLNEGLIGRAAALQKAIHADDYADDYEVWDNGVPVQARYESHAAIGVPMIYQDRAVGVITVFDTTSNRHFSDEDQRALEALAAPAATATVNGELYSRAHRLSQRLSVLLATQLQLSTHTVSHSSNMAMLKTVCQTVVSLFGCDGASIWLWQNGLLTRASAHFVNNTPQISSAFGWNEGFPGRALAQSSPLIEDDADQPNITRAAMPMLWQGQPVGVVIATYSRAGMRFNRDDVDLLSLFSQSVGGAIVNADLLSSLQAERDRLETILSSTVDPVLVADREARLVLLNPIAQSALHAVQGQSLLDLIGSQVAAPDTPDSLNDSLTGGVPFTFSMRVVRTIYSVRAAPLRQPEQGWVLVLRDVTGLKELEELKTRMIHMMAHDLKNPLTGIIGLSQMLVKKSDGFTTRQKDYVANIASSALRMEDLINNILDLEKASGSDLNTQIIDGDVLFRRLLSEFQAESKTRSQTIELIMPEEMPKLAVDEVQLYQAFTNLVSNALKYTPEAGHVIITVNVEGTMLHVAVKDDGIGIPRDKQDRLFERFYRVRTSETSHIPGTGLGLSLIKAVAEAHGGTVRVESEEHQGSTFHLSVPVVVPAE